MNFLFKRSESFKTIFTPFGQKSFVTILKSAILYLSKERVSSDEMSSALEKREEYSDYKFVFDLVGESVITLKQ